MIIHFDDLPAETRWFFLELSKKNLNGLLSCTRDWDAWTYKTMTSDDFINADEDEEVVYNGAVLIYDELFKALDSNTLDHLLRHHKLNNIT